MAKGMFLGVSNVARKVKAQSLGVSGVARKVRAGHLGVGNVARQFFVGGTPLSTKAIGSTVKIKESGTLVDFYVVKHNYESGLNGSGRTLLARKDLLDEGLVTWDEDGGNNYSTSDLDNWLNTTY